jgi:hypothetical protein
MRYDGFEVCATRSADPDDLLSHAVTCQFNCGFHVLPGTRDAKSGGFNNTREVKDGRSQDEIDHLPRKDSYKTHLQTEHLEGIQSTRVPSSLS